MMEVPIFDECYFCNNKLNFYLLIFKFCWPKLTILDLKKIEICNPISY